MIALELYSTTNLPVYGDTARSTKHLNGPISASPVRISHSRTGSGRRGRWWGRRPGPAFFRGLCSTNTRGMMRLKSSARTASPDHPRLLVFGCARRKFRATDDLTSSHVVLAHHFLKVFCLGFSSLVASLTADAQPCCPDPPQILSLALPLAPLLRRPRLCDLHSS